jgi:hypothetical protein
MPPIELPDRRYVYEAVAYDPQTGHFRWRERPPEHFPSNSARNRWNCRFAGTLAGSIHRDSRTGVKGVYLESDSNLKPNEQSGG